MAGGQRPPGTQGGASGPGPDRTTTDESTRTADSARTPSMKRGPQPTGTTPEPPKPQAPNPPTPEQGSHSNTTSGPATTRKGNPSAQEAQQTSGNAGRANATCEPDGPQGHGEGTSGQGSQGGGSRSRDPSAEWQQAGRRSRANRAFNPGQGSNRGKPGKSSGPPRKPKPTGNAKDAGKGPQPSDSRSGNSQSKRKANSNTSSGTHSNTSSGTHSSKSFKIPKKSYSAAAGASGSSSSNTATAGTPTAAADVEIGDLSLEEEASLHAESFKGIDHISVYIHTSRDRRLKITRDQFNYVWKTLQDLIFTALEAGQEIPPPVVLYFGEKGGRGVINCGDRTTAETVKRLVPNIVGPDGTAFNAWYRGETGDTLVTVIIEDKGLLEDHRIEPMLRLSNGLKHDDLAGFKVHKFPNTNLRKVTFGAHGETLERLKTIKSTRGKLNLGFLCCRMVISGQNQQQGQQVVQNPPQGNALVMPAGPLPAIAAPAIAEPMEGVEHQNPPQPQPGSVPPQGPGPAPERGADNTGAPQADQAAEQAARLAKEAASIFKSLIK